MFEKAKERWAKLEEDHESVRKVKTHVEKYQVIYAGAGASGLTLVAVSLFGKPKVIVEKGSGLMPVISPVFNNTPVIAPVMNNVVSNGGHMRKIVRCVETDQMWPSLSKAAEDLGVSLQKMSQHVNGHKEHVDGLHYVIEGLAAG